MQPSVSDYYRQKIIPDVSAVIRKESDAQILGTDPAELSAYYYDKFALEPIVEDSASAPTADPQQYFRTVRADEREGFYQHQGDIRDYRCERVVVEVPIIENPNLSLISSLEGNTRSMSYSASSFDWKGSSINYTIRTKDYGFEMNSDQIAAEVTRAVDRIREMLRWRKESITSENVAFNRSILQLIAERRDKIASDAQKMSELTKKISIPLKQKTPVGAQVVRLGAKPLVQRLKPQPSLPVEYVLDVDRVDDVINFLDSHAKGFESASQPIRDLPEEGLRDLLLGNLNTVFQGGATGETFSKKGKTDIYLQIAQGNILIVECKIWGGAQLYGETVDQLRGYLTWRQNYGIMLTFVRLKSGTRAISEAAKTIQSHPSYVNGFRSVADTHLVSNHRVDDDLKKVTLHHLFYHLA